jgi:hypothetical protein
MKFMIHGFILNTILINILINILNEVVIPNEV